MFKVKLSTLFKELLEKYLATNSGFLDDGWLMI